MAEEGGESFDCHQIPGGGQKIWLPHPSANPHSLKRPIGPLRTSQHLQFGREFYKRLPGRRLLLARLSLVTMIICMKSLLRLSIILCYLTFIEATSTQTWKERVISVNERAIFYTNNIAEMRHLASSPTASRC